MKNVIYLLIIVVAITIISCLLIEKKETASEVFNYGTLKGFQIGAYNDEIEANNVAKNNKGVYLYDGEKYNVFVAILKDHDNINRMVDYLNDNNRYFYLKDLDYIIDNTYLESLMKETTSDIAFLKMNNKILESYDYHEN